MPARSQKRRARSKIAPGTAPERRKTAPRRRGLAAERWLLAAETLPTCQNFVLIRVSGEKKILMRRPYVFRRDYFSGFYNISLPLLFAAPVEIRYSGIGFFSIPVYAHCDMLPPSSPHALTLRVVVSVLRYPSSTHVRQYAHFRSHLTPPHARAPTPSLVSYQKPHPSTRMRTTTHHAIPPAGLPLSL